MLVGEKGEPEGVLLHQSTDPFCGPCTLFCGMMAGQVGEVAWCGRSFFPWLSCCPHSLFKHTPYPMLRYVVESVHKTWRLRWDSACMILSPLLTFILRRINTKLCLELRHLTSVPIACVQKPHAHALQKTTPHLFNPV